MSIQKNCSSYENLQSWNINWYCYSCELTMTHSHAHELKYIKLLRKALFVGCIISYLHSCKYLLFWIWFSYLLNSSSIIWLSIRAKQVAKSVVIMHQNLKNHFQYPLPPISGQVHWSVFRLSRFTFASNKEVRKVVWWCLKAKLFRKATLEEG